MKKIGIFILVLIASCYVFGQNAKEIASKTLKATVSIYMLDNTSQMKSLGSGVIIGENLILSNFHVIDGAYSGYINLNNNETKYKIDGYLNIDKVNDLALIKVSGVSFTGIFLSSTKPEIGDKIYVAGNPQGLTGTFSDGIVSSIRSIENKELIQITAPISPGSSGGPVVNAFGDIIGIAVGAYTNGQNLNFAIPVNYVKTLINSKGEIKAISTLYKSSTGALNKSSINIQGIELRNIVWGETTEFYDSNYEQLLEFSIKNNTENIVGGVHLLLLVYDKSKTMVDFAEGFFEDDLQLQDIRIPPNMAKTFNATYSAKADYGGSRGPTFRKRIGYYHELRILDYEIFKQ